MYYNPNIPLETALEMFEDPHVRYEIIEDYHNALLRIVGDLALRPGDTAADGHTVMGYD